MSLQENKKTKNKSSTKDKKVKNKEPEIHPEIRMPVRFDNDHPHVNAMLAEAERLNKLGNSWLQAQVPNHIAAEAALRNGWAMNLAACWLRCKLNGEVK